MTDSTPLNLVTPDAGGAHVGELLRLSREAQGLTLDQLANQIKVSSIKLEALEQGRYDALGDSNFTRALAMTVCRTLRMDPAEVLAGLPAARLHALSGGKDPINAPFRDHGSVPALFDRGHRLSLKALLAPKWLAPLVFLGTAAIIYALPESIEWPSWWGGTETHVETPLAPTEEDAALPPSAMQVAADQALSPAAPDAASVASAPSVGPLEAASTVAAASSASSAPSAASVTASSSLSSVMPVSAPALAATPDVAPVQIVLTDSSWIEVVDASGSKVFSRIARAGESLALQGQAPFRLRIGNASAVQVSFKGQPVSLTGVTRNNTARVELK